MFKRNIKDRISRSDMYTIISLWIMGLFVTFILIGANARGILWVFLLGAFGSYFTLTRKK